MLRARSSYVRSRWAAGILRELTIATGGGGRLKFPNDGDDVRSIRRYHADADPFGSPAIAAPPKRRASFAWPSGRHCKPDFPGLVTIEVAGI